MHVSPRNLLFLFRSWHGCFALIYKLLQRLIKVYLAEQFYQIQRFKIYNNICECFFLATQFKNIIKKSAFEPKHEHFISPWYQTGHAVSLPTNLVDYTRCENTRFEFVKIDSKIKISKQAQTRNVHAGKSCMEKKCKSKLYPCVEQYE